jgi:DNA repair exonuclease SbcCD ATPase subunit
MENIYDLSKFFDLMSKQEQMLKELEKELQDSIKDSVEVDDTLCPYCGQKLPENASH